MQLMLGDCLERMREIPSGSVDLTVTSPPYDNLRTYNDTLTDWCDEKWQSVLRELFKVTRRGGAVVWIVSDATIDGSETGTSFKQALYAMECGFRLHDTMIWNKGSFSGVGALKVRYAPVFEYMFVFTKGSPNTFNAIKDRKNKHVGRTVTKTKRLPNGAISRGKPYVSSEFGQRYNIWDIFPHRQRGEGLHPAPFPISLATDHVLSWSNEGDTVLDPFMGSGTTGIACVSTGRKFIGIERDEGYFEIAEKRIQDAMMTKESGK